jgi:putative ABC transport system permease protein
MLSGVVVGLPASYFLLKLVGGLIYGLTADSLWSAAPAVVVLSLTALAAASIPARRAARVDAMIALRWE